MFTAIAMHPKGLTPLKLRAAMGQLAHVEVPLPGGAVKRALGKLIGAESRTEAGQPAGMILFLEHGAVVIDPHLITPERQVRITSADLE